MSVRAELAASLLRYAQVEHEVALSALYADLPRAIEHFINQRAAEDLARRMEAQERALKMAKPVTTANRDGLLSCES